MSAIERAAAMPMFTVEIENVLAKGTIKFIKKDVENDAVYLPEAYFSLFMKNEKDGEYTQIRTDLFTDTNGELVITDLLPGKYKLVETQAPDGYYFEEYEKETLFEVKLDDNGTLDKLADRTITNQPFVNLRIIKIDGNNKSKGLDGAIFKLVKVTPDSEGKKDMEDLIDDHLTSDGDGVIIVTGLRHGKYKLTELTAPYGYLLPENAERTIDL